MTDWEQIKRVYDAVADSYAELIPDLRVEQPLDVAMLDEFTREVGKGESAAVLDAGCGAGRLSGHLGDRGCAVTGIDMSSEMVRVARDTHRNARFDVGDISDLPYVDGAFDGVVAWYSIIHTPPADLAAMFAGFRRVLRPQAPLLLGFQRGSGTRWITGAYGHDSEMSAELHQPDAVAALLDEAGFTVTATVTHGPGEFDEHHHAIVLARRTSM